MVDFVHLHCYSQYSIDQSLMRINELAQGVKKQQMNAVALTDKANLFAAVKFYRACVAEQIKPIFGAELTLKEDNNRFKVLLLCQNHQGYLNLSNIISTAYLAGSSDERGVYYDKQTIWDNNEGLIVIAEAFYSDVAQHLSANRYAQAKQAAMQWQQLFTGRYYLAIERVGRANGEHCLHQSVDLALALKLPLVATNAVNFLTADDFEAHEARVCIAEGGLLDDDRRPRRFSAEQYLKSSAEMNALFSDIPEALENSVEIARRCNVKFELNTQNYLPQFPIANNYDSAEQLLIDKTNRALAALIKTEKLAAKRYQQRLDFELGVINNMAFAGYFLIVADFIAYAKQQAIPVGPGRGSGAGSLVAYVLGITNVDPIEHGLLFERFLNPERVSMPDFDIDFCADRRDMVIDYVADKYGSDKVVQIITYGTMAAKGVVRDIGRVLGHPYGFGDSLSRLIPNDLKMTLTKALAESPELRSRYDSETSVRSLIDLAIKLEGLVRNVGTHAGGVVIAPSQVSDFCPVYKGSGVEDKVVAQFDKDDIEAIGLVKFDFLGLSNLTVVDKTVQTIESFYGKKIDIDKLPLDDAQVYQLLQTAETTGIFQMESEGMRLYLEKLQADNFEDIVAMLALYRPGPLDAGMVDDYINVKHGEQAKYPHPMLSDTLSPTNGIFLYQEQVMQAAQIMAGYTLGSADLLRRAMGKKKPEEMEQQRAVFIKGAAKHHNIDAQKAQHIFNLIEKFSGYGFNKSHSVAYALISYQTAWLKSHYPSAFMAAVLSGVMGGNDDRLYTLIQRCRLMGLSILLPNVNNGHYDFTMKDKTAIYYGLGAIKGVGKRFVEGIVKARLTSQSNAQPYQGLFDFCARVESKLLNRRALEALVLSGAFDGFAEHRATLMAAVDGALKYAQHQQQQLLSGQSDLFGTDKKHTNSDVYDQQTPWSMAQQLKREKSVLGFYLSAHPVDQYRELCHLVGTVIPSELVYRNNREVRLLGLIVAIRYRNQKNGQMAQIVLEDGDQQVAVVVFARTLEKVSALLIIDQPVVIGGKIKKDFRDQWQVVADNVENVDNLKSSYAQKVHIMLSEHHEQLFEKLARLLQDNRGKCPVQLTYQTQDKQGTIKLNGQWQVFPHQQLIDKINNLLETDCVKIDYGATTSLQ